MPHSQAQSHLITAQSADGSGTIAIHNPNANPVLVYLPQDVTPFQPIQLPHQHSNLNISMFGGDTNREPPPFVPLHDDYSTNCPKNYMDRIAALQYANQASFYATSDAINTSRQSRPGQKAKPEGKARPEESEQHYEH